jgi:hypothetical protein
VTDSALKVGQVWRGNWSDSWIEVRITGFRDEKPSVLVDARDIHDEIQWRRGVPEDEEWFLAHAHCVYDPGDP